MNGPDFYTMIESRMAAGLTRDQAVSVINAQMEHDALLAESSTPTPAPIEEETPIVESLEPSSEPDGSAKPKKPVKGH